MSNAGIDKIMESGGANVFEAGGAKLTKTHKKKFIADVIALMTIGNEGGMGLAKTSSPLLPIPIMPFPGPEIPSPTILNPLNKDKLFHFGPDPTAPLSIPFLLKEDGPYQKLIVDGLYQPLMGIFNQAGQPAFPIFDPTIFMDLTAPKIKNLTIPDIPSILIELVILGNLSQIKPMPGLVADLILFDQYGIGPLPKLDLIKLILSAPVPSIPIPIPPLPPIPEVPNIGIPNFFLIDLALGLFKIPVDLVPQLFSMFLELPTNPIDIFTKIFEIVAKIILKLLEPILLLAVPKLLIATLTVIVRNMVAGLICFLIGKILGTGILVKIFAGIGGLIIPE